LDLLPFEIAQLSKLNAHRLELLPFEIAQINQLNAHHLDLLPFEIAQINLFNSHQFELHQILFFNYETLNANLLLNAEIHNFTNNDLSGFSHLPPPLMTFEVLSLNGLTFQTFFDEFEITRLKHSLYFNDPFYEFTILRKDRTTYKLKTQGKNVIENAKEPIHFADVLKIFLSDQDFNIAIEMIQEGEFNYFTFEKTFNSETAYLIAGLLLFKGANEFEQLTRQKAFEIRKFDQAIEQLLNLPQNEKMNVLKTVNFPVFELLETLSFSEKQTLKGLLQ
jgi:hypothetical protein